MSLNNPDSISYRVEDSSQPHVEQVAKHHVAILQLGWEMLAKGSQESLVAKTQEQVIIALGLQIACHS